MRLQSVYTVQLAFQRSRTLRSLINSIRVMHAYVDGECQHCHAADACQLLNSVMIRIERSQHLSKPICKQAVQNPNRLPANGQS